VDSTPSRADGRKVINCHGLAFEQQLSARIEIRPPRLQDFLRAVESFAEQVAHGTSVAIKY
jgi:hypothetical protein